LTLPGSVCFVCLFWGIYRGRDNFQSFGDVQLITSGGRPRVQRDTRVEPPTYRKPAGRGSSHENPKYPDGIRNQVL